jgi:hypothetical protein
MKNSVIAGMDAISAAFAAGKAEVGTSIDDIFAESGIDKA